MIKTLYLENFKCFGQRTEIPMAPITLIFGQNSAGKSAILQSLLLLKQSVEASSPTDVLVPRTENGLVDLGSYRDFVHDHDSSSAVSIGIMFDTTTAFADKHGYPDHSGIQWSFRFCSNADQIKLRELVFYLGRTDNVVARFGSKTSVATDIDPLFKERDKPLQRQPGFEEAGANEQSFMEAFPIAHWEHQINACGYLELQYCFREKDLWSGLYECFQKNREEISVALQEYLLLTEKKAPPDGARSSLSRSLRARYEKTTARLVNAIEFHADDYSPSSFIDYAVRTMPIFVGYDGIAPIVVPTYRKQHSCLESMAVAVREKSNHSVFESDVTLELNRCETEFFDRLDRLIYSQVPWQEHFRAMHAFGGVRPPPRRKFDTSGQRLWSTGPEGRLMPEFLYHNRDDLSPVNEWLEQLDLHYKLVVRPLSEAASDMFVLELIDTRRVGCEIAVNFADVGFGISQLLPLIVQALIGHDQVILAQQPEVHIHPGLQANLATLFLDGIGRERNNQFIVETHSEHLILRLQRLVRRGEMLPEEVSVLYVQRGDDGSSVKQLRLGKDGQFLDGWPGGFFPERLDELFGD